MDDDNRVIGNAQYVREDFLLDKGMIDNFHVTIGEVDTAIDIMREVAQWCNAAGLNMWKPEKLTRERQMKGLSADNFYVGRIGEANACCMILQWNDPVFWPSAKENEAGYIHKLCVMHEFMGTGLSRKLVEYAIEECKKREIKYLRLDTGWHRERLCKHYENLGFRKVGKLLFRNYDYALYEMKLE